MVYIVTHLEKILRAWEDYWYLCDMMNQVLLHQGLKPAVPREKAILNYGKFRKFLLSILKGSSGNASANDFREPNIPEMRNKFFESMAPSIADWCSSSRRVFSLTQELQILLDATSLDGVSWSEVHLPFAAFAITLEKPLVDCDGWKWDFILARRFIAIADDRIPHHRFEVRAFRDKCDKYEPLTEFNKQNIAKRMRAGEFHHVEKLILRFLRRINIGFGGSWFSFGIGFENELVVKTAEIVLKGAKESGGFNGVERGTAELWDAMTRIIVGMCLYLKTLPPKSSQQSDWKPAYQVGRPDPNAITDGALVCSVSSCFKLTPEERQILGLDSGGEKQRAHYELRCHFREGHWRRPPGLGDDPVAEKTVWVRPTIVRRDRLQNSQLPGGAEKII